MSPKSVQFVAFLVLLVHGIGHLQGVLSSAGVKMKSTNPGESWLMGGSNQKRNRIVCCLLYLFTGISGVLAALSLKDILLPTTIWPQLALLTAFLSTACLILFPKALAMLFNKVGAIAVNILVFYSILFEGYWPSALFED